MKNTNVQTARIVPVSKSLNSAIHVEWIFNAGIAALMASPTLVVFVYPKK